jgi:hypothetical protein
LLFCELRGGAKSQQKKNYDGERTKAFYLITESVEKFDSVCLNDGVNGVWGGLKIGEDMFGEELHDVN